MGGIGRVLPKLIGFAHIVDRNVPSVLNVRFTSGRMSDGENSRCCNGRSVKWVTLEMVVLITMGRHRNKLGMRDWKTGLRALLILGRLGDRDRLVGMVVMRVLVTLRR